MLAKSVPIKTLKPHPKNTYYFDDVIGEKWSEFIDSIRENGIKEPIIITQDNTIVSGHQRVRAAKELGITEVDVIQYDYETEDDVLLDLIDLNIKQRGIMGDSETKAGRRFRELKRINGVRHGNNQHDTNRTGQVVPSKSVDQLAEEYGLSKRQMNRTIQVADSDPMLQEWNISGKISGDTIRYMMKQLSPEEREDFYTNNEDVAKIRKKDIQEYEKLKKKYDSLSSENEELKSSITINNEETNLLPPQILSSPLPQDIPDDKDEEIDKYKTKIKSLELELSELRAIHNPIETEANYGSDIFDFCVVNNQYITKIVELQYSDSFRKIRADRTLPLDSLFDSCGKVMDALQELMKQIKTESYVDVIY